MLVVSFEIFLWCFVFQNQNLSCNTKVCKEVIRNIVRSCPRPSKKISWLGKKNSEFSIWATHKSDSHDTNLMTDLPAQLTWCKYGLFIYMLKLKYACAKVQTWANSLEIHPMGIRLNPGPTNCQELPISTASHMTLALQTKTWKQQWKTRTPGGRLYNQWSQLCSNNDDN